MSHSIRILHFNDSAYLQVNVKDKVISFMVHDGFDEPMDAIVIKPSEVQEIIKMLREALK